MTIKYSSQRGKVCDTDLLRIQMIQRGLTYRDLAMLAGIVPQRVANLLSNKDRSWPMRAKINRALRLKLFKKPKNTRRQRIRKEKAKYD